MQERFIDFIVTKQSMLISRIKQILEEKLLCSRSCMMLTYISRLLTFEIRHWWAKAKYLALLKFSIRIGEGSYTIDRKLTFTIQLSWSSESFTIKLCGLSCWTKNTESNRHETKCKLMSTMAKITTLGTVLLVLRLS